MKTLSPEEIKEIEVVVGRVSAPEVVAPVENETQRILRNALKRFGPNGQRWTGRGGHICATTAIEESHSGTGPFPRDALEVLAAARGVSYYTQIWAWNDAPERKFSDIQALYAKAIDLAATP